MTRSLMWMFGVVAMLAPGTARADDLELDCEHASATMELELCADREFAAVDAALNAAYREAGEGLDPATRAELRDAQRAWLAFRDAECAFDLADKDGSGHNLAHLACLKRLTERRTRQLKGSQ